METLSHQFHCVVDSVDEQHALLVCYGNDAPTFSVPPAVLPAGTREGDHLRITISTDPEARDREAQKAQELLKELTSGQDPLQNTFEL